MVGGPPQVPARQRWWHAARGYANKTVATAASGDWIRDLLETS
jgi:hypothetical protein